MPRTKLLNSTNTTATTATKKKLKTTLKDSTDNSTDISTATNVSNNTDSANTNNAVNSMDAVVTKERRVEQLISLHIEDIAVRFNIRHGWDSDSSKISKVYEKHIEELERSILRQGFKISEPVEIFEEKTNLGEIEKSIHILKEGHHRLEACKRILARYPDHVFAPGLPPGHIWCAPVIPPSSTVDLITSQIDSNKSLGNTVLDIAKAAYTLSHGVLVDDDGNEIPKDKKSARENVIARALGFTSRLHVQRLLRLYAIDNTIKDWVQESALSGDDDEFVTISWTAVNKVVDLFKDDKNAITKAGKVLLTAKAKVDKGEDVDLFGRTLRATYLENIARKLYPENFRPPATTTSTTPATTTPFTTTPATPTTPTTLETTIPDENLNFNSTISSIDSSIENGNSNTSAIATTKTQSSNGATKSALQRSQDTQLKLNAALLKAILEIKDNFFHHATIDGGIGIVEMKSEQLENIQEILAQIDGLTDETQKRKDDNINDNGLLNELPNTFNGFHASEEDDFAKIGF